MFKNKNTIYIAVLLQIMFFSSAFSQNHKGNDNAVIEGKVYDSKTSTPIEFATVMLVNKNDTTKITGTATNDKGKFLFEKVFPGQYYIRVSFVGTDNYRSKVIAVKPASKIDLGKINLSSKNLLMKDVTVKGERSSISYQIDKKVINVSESLTAMSGTAVDVLENVPSVTVDIDGNVSLRGSGNFQVLIDGRPSILASNEALQQIPASSIENIEIITNPSAKYDPTGTAGIINVILKKNENWGFSGTANLNGGVNNKYGSDCIVSLKNENIESTLGLSYDKRYSDGSVTDRSWIYDGQKTSYHNANGTNNGDRESYTLRGSLSFDFGDKRLLTFGGRYSDRKGDENSSSNYLEWTSLNLVQNDYLSNTDQNRSGDELSIFANYKHPFNNLGHEIYIEASYDDETSKRNNTTRLFNQGPVIDGKINNEDSKDSEIRGKMDYTLPLNEEDKLEIGYKGQYETSNEKNNFSIYNVDLKSFQDNPLYSNDGKYYTGQHSLYAVYTSRIDRFGYKLGLRNEYTGRNIKVNNSTQYTINRWEYFPTLHLSYELGGGNQIMSSYTKRINRPDGWDLEPVITWIDAYNVRKGNPNLLPEYIDSYELGYQMMLDKSLFSIDAYYRVTKNKIERVISVYSDEVTLQTSNNVGKDYSLGTELFFNFDPIHNWNVNLMANLYNYSIDAVMNNADVVKNSFNWSLRFNNSIKLASATSFQLNTQYNSASVSSQGKREDYIATNLGIKQDLFNRFMTATLQVRDLFRTAKYEFVNESSDFYRYRYYKRESPVVMLSLRFNFNNFDIEKHSEEGNGDEILKD